ncbi:MAG: DUF5011 domain-containing protein [Bacilli bacterium]|nr:DUF5011 domain-containing protein [Bacilli bacterium]
MNKKGFTLIELLAVIVLLGVLGVVIIPNISDSINNSKQSAYQAQIESMKKGINDFLIDNSEILSRDGTYTFSLGAIKQGGYLPINIKNPITRKNFANYSQIIVKVIGGKYEISFNLIDLTDVDENIDGNSPILILNGNYIEYVEVNSTYTDLGAFAKDSTGQELELEPPQIKKGDIEVTSIDTSSLNTYSIIYGIIDNGHETKATRTVVVRDSTAPVINVPTNTQVLARNVSTFNIMDGVTISDNYDEDVTVTTNSSLSNIPGNYVITYTATDSSGNTSTVRRVINVVDVDYNISYKIKGKTIKSSPNNPTMDNPVSYTGLGATGKINIVSIGKNFFDKNKYLKLEDYTIELDNYISAKINLKPNTTYKVSISRKNDYEGKDNNLLISSSNNFEASDWSAIAHKEYPDYSTTNFQHTTGDDGVLYIGYQKTTTQSDLDTIWANTDVQIEEGTVASEFEPYKGGQTTINMTGHDPLMCVNDICDYIDYKNNKIVRYVKEFVFDENNQLYFSNWDTQTEKTWGIWYARNEILGKYGEPLFVTEKGFSTHFIYGDSGYTPNDTLRFSVTMGASPPYISFRIPIAYDTQEKWDIWLTEQKNAGTPLKVYLLLIEPVYEDIKLPNIDLYGSYNTFVTDGNMSVNLEIIK